MSIKIDSIVYSSRKHISLKIDREGRLIVHAPLHTSKREILDAVEHHIKWIEKTRKKILEKREQQRKRFVEGEKFLFLGKEYPLKIVKSLKEPIEFQNAFFLSEAYSQQGIVVFEWWYKNKAREILISRVKELARKHGFKPRKIKITSGKTRFGSCTANGHINLSWRLVLAPLEVIDYVIIHELAHLKEHNHSKKFWTLVEKFIPDYKARRKWLKENGHLLVFR